jgi:hypothetical protein
MAAVIDRALSAQTAARTPRLAAAEALSARAVEAFAATGHSIDARTCSLLTARAPRAQAQQQPRGAALASASLRLSASERLFNRARGRARGERRLTAAHETTVTVAWFTTGGAHLQLPFAFVKGGDVGAPPCATNHTTSTRTRCIVLPPDFWRTLASCPSTVRTDTPRRVAVPSGVCPATASARTRASALESPIWSEYAETARSSSLSAGQSACTNRETVERTAAAEARKSRSAARENAALPMVGQSTHASTPRCSSSRPRTRPL